MFHYRYLVYKIVVLSILVQVMYFHHVVFLLCNKDGIFFFGELYDLKLLVLSVGENPCTFTVCPTMYRFPCIYVYTHPSLNTNACSTRLIRRTYVTPEN